LTSPRRALIRRRASSCESLCGTAILNFAILTSYMLVATNAPWWGYWIFNDSNNLDISCTI
jgi:hypothetical protein